MPDRRSGTYSPTDRWSGRVTVDILVVGAGIAGQTLAYWLARHGMRPTLVERAPRPRTGGNGVDLRGQAIEVAERMGIMPRVRAAAADVRGIAFVDATGRAVARIDMRRLQSRGGEVEIMRGDLVALLREVTPPEVEYVFGDSVRTLEEDGGGVTVSFEGGSTRRFDLVVGADGLHSTVRRLAFGPEERFLRHMGYCFAFADADSALGEDRWMTMYNLPGRMAGVYRSGNHAQAKAYLVFRSEPQAYDHRDLGRQRKMLEEAFGRETSWRVRELLDGVLADPDCYVDMLSQARVPSWSSGRVALVGDAAYCASPASGAGAELAVVGAYRLAEELAGASGHRAAFQRYEQGLRGLVRSRQRIGPNVRMMVPKSRLGMWTRNLLASSMGLLARRQ
ncbi:FAD-dependent oxidoreductase [Nonomuraea phyllanthi]|uniref:FAD-dependent oxidoreductase n=1 Tax=Nonomuraea phyllanthi TaxID=2219224 RepID=A0A5C4VI95_9ACTN|nr:FAD-dependent oxidoreductase [Nonomuraea phyllanthi]